MSLANVTVEVKGLTDGSGLPCVYVKCYLSGFILPVCIPYCHRCGDRHRHGTGELVLISGPDDKFK